MVRLGDFASTYAGLISKPAVHQLMRLHADDLPLIAGATDAVARLAREYRLAVASSADMALIAAILSHSGLAHLFEKTISPEEVPRGKPAPDIYLEACRRMRAKQASSVAIEDSTNGILSAWQAGLRVIAIPHPD